MSAIKYYRREGLLPSGHHSAPTQATYTEFHLQRIRLVRALLETGGLSIATARAVIVTLEADTPSLEETFRTAQHALGARTAPKRPPAPETSTPDVNASAGAYADGASSDSTQRISDLATELGWTTSADNPGLDIAARALDGLAAIDFHAPPAYLYAYARAAELAADADLQALRVLPTPEQVTELMVVGTVLGDPLFAGLRRLAQQHVTATRFTTDLTTRHTTATHRPTDDGDLQ